MDLDNEGAQHVHAGLNAHHLLLKALHFSPKRADHQGRAMVKAIARSDLRNMKRIVVKAGTSVLSRPEGTAAITRIADIVEQIANLKKSGYEVIFVASGAVGMGRQILNKHTLLSSSLRSYSQGTGITLGGHPTGACAAAGQAALMSLYDTMFSQFSLTCSQVLVLASDFKEQTRIDTLSNTIDTLLKIGVVPVLNENDAVGAPPDASIFSDNDSLATLIGATMNADLVILLTDVDGLYTAPPGSPGAKLISTYTDSSEFTIGEKSAVGRGGMGAKIGSAMHAIKQGLKAVVIASGFRREMITSIMKGDEVGTLFVEASDDPSTGHEVLSAEEMARQCRTASFALKSVSSDMRSRILFAIADKLLRHADEILAANVQDMAAANSISEVLRARLKITQAKLEDLATGIRSIADSEEPLGKVTSRMELSDGLILQQETTAIGVLIVIFESRPESLPQIAALALRSGNGLLLKGGKEAQHSNHMLHSLITQTVEEVSEGVVPASVIGLVKSRDEISDLLKLDHVVDLCIPRGSNELVQNIKANTKIPVLGHADGICHVFLDEGCETEKAIKIVVDSKTNYPAACNAAETVLIHQSNVENGLAGELMLALNNAEVKVYGGPVAVEMQLVPESMATDDFHVEYGDFTITIEVVPDIQTAISHINQHGSGHTECIVTENHDRAQQFMHVVDSACLFHNASTRFADGFRFGLGAEVGISTGRIHARGPVGVEGLLTTKWKLYSNDEHIVADFAAKEGNEATKRYSHRALPILQAAPVSRL